MSIDLGGTGTTAKPTTTTTTTAPPDNETDTSTNRLPTADAGIQPEGGARRDGHAVRIGHGPGQ